MDRIGYGYGYGSGTYCTYEDVFLRVGQRFWQYVMFRAHGVLAGLREYALRCAAPRTKQISTLRVVERQAKNSFCAIWALLGHPRPHCWPPCVVVWALLLFTAACARATDRHARSLAKAWMLLGDDNVTQFPPLWQRRPAAKIPVRACCCKKIRTGLAFRRWKFAAAAPVLYRGLYETLRCQRPLRTMTRRQPFPFQRNSREGLRARFLRGTCLPSGNLCRPLPGASSVSDRTICSLAGAHSSA